MVSSSIHKGKGHPLRVSSNFCNHQHRAKAPRTSVHRYQDLFPPTGKEDERPSRQMGQGRPAILRGILEGQARGYTGSHTKGDGQGPPRPGQESSAQGTWRGAICGWPAAAVRPTV